MTNENQKAISIYIVEDYALIRKSLAFVLNKKNDFVVSGAFESAEECIEAMKTNTADVIIMDLGLGGMNGLDATQFLKKHYPDTKVLILSSHESQGEVLAALSVGANGYCMKDVETETLYTVINQIYNGALWIHPHIASVVTNIGKKDFSELNNICDSKEVPFDLTERELEVLELVVEGKSNTEIADIMQISPHTAKAHVCNILEKMSVSDRVQAAVKAVKNRLV